MTGITAASAGGSTMALYVHSSGSSELRIYNHLEGLTSREKITWLYFPLLEGEVVVEVGVRGFPKADYSALWFPSLSVCTMHTLQWTLI